MISKWRYVLIPLILINWLRSVLRDRLFDLGVWKSVSFEVPVIYVGSLAKNPTIGISRYIQALTRGAMHVSRFSLTTLSLAKKQENKGHYLTSLTAENVFCTSHKVLGLSEWFQSHAHTSAFVMNDEYMQNEIRPQMRILITDYTRPYSSDLLSPVGELRMPKGKASLADAIVVCQTPEDADCEKMELNLRQGLSSEVPVFFIKNSNQSLKAFNSEDKIEFISDRHNFERLIYNVLPKANPDSE